MVFIIGQCDIQTSSFGYYKKSLALYEFFYKLLYDACNIFSVVTNYVRAAPPWPGALAPWGGPRMGNRGGGVLKIYSKGYYKNLCYT